MSHFEGKPAQKKVIWASVLDVVTHTHTRISIGIGYCNSIGGCCSEINYSGQLVKGPIVLRCLCVAVMIGRRSCLLGSLLPKQLQGQRVGRVHTHIRFRPGDSFLALLSKFKQRNKQLPALPPGLLIFCMGAALQDFVMAALAESDVEWRRPRSSLSCCL